MANKEQGSPDCWEPEVYKYKGSPVLKIPTGEGYSMSFGLRKAKAILENLKAIQAFVDSEGENCGTEGVHRPTPPPTDDKPF